MRITTGNFANQKKYTNAGYTCISIARFNRYFNGIEFKKLAPDAYYIKYPECQYIPIYEKKLDKLNAKNVYNELKILSNGNDIVLLCYEKEGVFCHRILVAKWLKKELGIEVKELGKMEKKEELF